MGENQGMVWIIVGVIVVGVAVFVLGEALGGTVGETGSTVDSKLSEAIDKA